ncbi:uncharacterized protein [Diabrotica undecimpunctata]|uniref:uncharacterized protein n=1 Tax=Diabrotica undecimpunctata TaxID=50387 RepID=UPI003B63B15D
MENFQKSVEIVTLLGSGLSQRQVARQLNVSRSTAQRNQQRFIVTGSHQRRPGTGPKRKTTAREDRVVILAALRNQTQTARRFLLAVWVFFTSLTACSPATGPLLSPAHKRRRLDFACEHINCTADDWKKVLFTDECRMSIYGKDGRSKVYRRAGERSAGCIWHHELLLVVVQ